MTQALRFFSVTAAVLILLVIIELVRRRKMREEYSLLWIIAGITMLVLSFSYDFMIYVGNLFGGILPATILYLFAILFLVLINLHYSVKISELSGHVKDLSQEIALLRAEREKNDGG